MSLLHNAATSAATQTLTVTTDTLNGGATVLEVTGWTPVGNQPYDQTAIDGTGAADYGIVQADYGYIALDEIESIPEPLDDGAAADAAGGGPAAAAAQEPDGHRDHFQNLPYRTGRSSVTGLMLFTAATFWAKNHSRRDGRGAGGICRGVGNGRMPAQRGEAGAVVKRCSRGSGGATSSCARPTNGYVKRWIGRRLHRLSSWA